MSISRVLEIAQRVGEGRDVKDVMLAVSEEVGELATEIRIIHNGINKDPGVDGIVGEAVDSIITLLDIIYLTEPDITEEDINLLLVKKAGKWAKKENLK